MDFTNGKLIAIKFNFLQV